ncbi:transporter substrate-binding domain-containing protein [Lysinibacillus sp. fkY74-1]|uniref:ABC transporter substrate-binding protein n=3 Tax=Lysinibacillus TaxID=400634 RepID=W7REQ1_LYSSH|nr:MULTISPECIES: transporter substrate-binding domain-containing protein [Lysinibacillus]MBE5086379.1 transporter substrate-binding domain-containing protein [Bacillus thuringiensis]ACA38292.1 Probable amino-acid ABC transporter extracellular-binding protein yqiX precursor [Lysinibacillus sphaericus C3-41]AMO31404.1 ABC transporter substrate-binding protein [Lysinibacillus sphaericus]AMR89484.1 ABC transporter substrate-binding protein [Lysinibacillus sphaericus]ANA47555.1 ABC transporter subs
MKNKLFMMILVLAIGVLAACGAKEDDANNSNADSSTDKQVLKVGTSADYAPFEYVDAAKGEEIIGFDIDLIKLVGEKIGVDMQVQDMDFNSLVPALQAGKIDVVISGMTPNPEREKVVDFSDQYNETEQVIIVKKDSGIKKEADLAGKKVGVQTASIQENLGNEIAKKVDVSVEGRTRIPEIIQDMMSKRLDAGILEGGVAKGYLKTNDQLAAFPVEEQPEDFKAIAVPKGSNLKEKINKALKELAEEGKIQELEEKWLEKVE